jgi:single-stranded-DNA-specific exonuclease
MAITSIRRLPTTRWHLREGNQDIQDLLVRELDLNPIISKIIMNRDIVDSGEARRYLSPSLYDLHNPFLMQDMKKAVDRLVVAIYGHEQVVIYGDYDADGITSVVVLLRFLRQIHPKVSYYIPDRINEGYGLHREALERLRSEGTSLIITVDCGMSDHEQIAYARQLGMDTIILDHHELSDRIPDAVAAVNPHRTDCRFPFKHLAGRVLEKWHLPKS